MRTYRQPDERLRLQALPTDSSAKTFRDTIPFAERLTCTINEACEATGLGRTKLYELIGQGCLDTTTIGRRRLVLVRSLRTLLDANEVRGSQ